VSERVTLDQTPDGRILAVKRSRGPDDAERLRREAEVLAVARHPGVVELVALHEDPEHGEVRLLTIAVGSGPLGLLPRPPVPRVAAIATAVATTLADLHLHGIAHGRVDGSHVLLDGDGRPVLCGFAEATTRLASANRHRDTAPNAAHGEGPADGPTAADDVAGLGRLVLLLLGHDTDVEPIPELRRLPSRRRRQGWTGYQQRALLTLADQASADEPQHRPSARAFAAALTAAFPDARLDDVASSTDPDPEEGAAGEHADPPRAAGARTRRVLVAAGAAAVGVLGLTSLAAGTSSVRGGERPTVVDGDASTTVPAADASSPTSASGTAPPTSRAPAPDCPDATGPVADLDGDGCASALTVEGTVVSGDGGRFQVGEEGDEVVVGDWDCDGTATPALLRPDAGDVFVFDRWARDGIEVTVRAVDQVPGATAVEVEPDGDCDLLAVEGPEGRRTVDVQVPIEVEATAASSTTTTNEQGTP
jgi:HAMP domain-containing protein